MSNAKQSEVLPSLVESLQRASHNPDVLSCLANLSNDEVFTPPELVNDMLDMLPEELFRDPNATFLDPVCKSGVFLREIAKRLIEGLKPVFPDLRQRLDHIYKKQLFGVAITELTSLLSRRSLYCSAYPNGPHSIVKFDGAEGNIRFRDVQHVWENGKCFFCGASQLEYGDEVRGVKEKHAYEFIHCNDPTKWWNMKFDVIIGNPPYQLSDGGAQASASPLYDKFVDMARQMEPKHLIMIIPARWYAGGKGLNEFRSSMLTDTHIKELHDFPNTDDCFPGVNIRGGICYFLWERGFNNENLVNVVTHDKDKVQSILREFKYKDLDLFIRNGQSLSILEKVTRLSKEPFLSEYVSPRKPFGLTTDFTKDSGFHDTPLGMKQPVPCYGKGKKIGFVELDEIPCRREWIGKWKVFTSRANNIGTELVDDNQNTFIGKEEICLESYVVVGADLNLSKSEAENLSSYLQTKFARFCHSLAKSSQDATSKTYRFVPMQDFSKSWTDEELYAKYGLKEEEIEFIESMIRPMD